MLRGGKARERQHGIEEGKKGNTLARKGRPR